MSRGLEDYVDVATRIARFYEPSTGKTIYGCITSEILVDDGKRVVMKSRVYRYEDGVKLIAGEGHAEEVRGAGMVNKTSALENCETSAWGRALAAAGLEVRAGIASRQEMEKVQRMTEEAPKQPKPLTPGQLKQVNTKLEGVDPLKIELVLAGLGVEKVEELTVAQAKELVAKVTVRDNEPVAA